jgi:hypothetical protein
VLTEGTRESVAARSVTHWRETITADAWLRIDANCLATIKLLIGTEFLHLVLDARTAKEAWDALKEYFQSQQEARQLEMILNLCQLRMEPKESVSSYFGRAQRLRHSVMETGAQVTLSEYKLRLTAGLTREYEGVRDYLTDKITDDSYTPTMLAARLLSKEQELRAYDRGGKAVADAMGLAAGDHPARGVPRGEGGGGGKPHYGEGYTRRVPTVDPTGEIGYPNLPDGNRELPVGLDRAARRVADG